MAALDPHIPSLCGIFADYQVQRCTKDDLPKHVKGPHIWFCNGNRSDGTFLHLLQGYCIERDQEEIAVEFLHIAGRDNWYQLIPKQGERPEDNYWITNSKNRFTQDNNKFGLGFLEED